MKKILKVGLIAVALGAMTSCSIRLSEQEKDSDYYNTIFRGRELHNFIVIYNQNEKILENQELIIKQNEEILKALNEKN